MKILFDHQVFWLQQYGGISRYYVELMERLHRREDADAALALWYSENQHLLSSPLVRDELAPTKPPLFDLVKWGQKKTGKDLIGYLDHRVSKKALRKGDFDIFHPTYYYPYFLDRLAGKPFVLTVYDMTHEIMPRSFPPDNPTARHKKMLAERAERVIAISHSTKKDLVRICGIDPSKVTVVHLASSLDAAVRPERPEGLPERYVLFVGKRDGYKNFELFIDAMAGILAGDPTMHIVCGGGGGLTPAEQALLKAKGIEGRVRQVGVSDPVLVSLYKGAAAFVYPSLYEGFGIPILEAFDCGCPVIAADSSSFPEVAGTAGLLFDPKSSSSLREAIEKVLTDEKMRSGLVDRGHKRVKEFSWDRMTEETRAIYGGIA